ncbi:hypothetical protein Leryth_006459 [Lithospermum erythrorhizon]|nr:hypothetical protein Leryth_006459 [Lithospermum erythrorhizon]
MSSYEKDETPILPPSYSKSDEYGGSQFQRFPPMGRSASLSIPMSPVDSFDDSSFVGHTGPLRNERRTSVVQMSGPLYRNHKKDNVFRPGEGAWQLNTMDSKMETYPSLSGMDQNDWKDNIGKNEHLLKSGQLGMCNDPYCTTCPTYYKINKQRKHAKSSDVFDSKHNIFYGETKGWTKKMSSFCDRFIPGVMNPHTQLVQRWNKFFVIACLFAVFLDPLFFFLLSVQKDHKCIVTDPTMTTTLAVLRSMTDFVYLLHILLQFRLAYVDPESKVVGAGDLVDHPRKIALHYLSGYFMLDFFNFLPLPQIIILGIRPSSADYQKNLLRTVILAQYVPRLCRVLPLFAGQSTSSFVFETAWANFIMNLLTFVLSGHVVGSCWYLFGLQRVNRCLKDVCRGSGIGDCMRFIDCGDDNNGSMFADPSWGRWNATANSCFDEDGFKYGIYVQTVNLTTKHSLVTRYIYSLFWGFQQISTLAGNQVPSYYEWEVLFTMGIIALGLLLFALLIGNMQNFLQSLGRRRLELSLRRRDVEQWMSHRRLSEDLKRKVRAAERFNWAATRGVNEELILEDLPEDLQREIRRHLCSFIKKVRLFSLLDEVVLDAVCERLRQKTYIKDSKVLTPGGLIDKMVFIIRGEMKSTGEDGDVSLSEGKVCGEELLRWCLEHSSINKEQVIVA